MVLISGTRVIGIYFILQLSYPCLAGITTRRRLVDSSSIPPHSLIIDKTALLGGGAFARFPSPANKHHGLHLEQSKVNADEVRRGDGNGNKKWYSESPVAAGVIVPLWEENHAGRMYLPPDRVAGTYGPAKLVAAAAAAGFPSSTPRSHSIAESWMAYWKNQAQFGRAAAENPPPGGARSTEPDTIKNNNDNRDVPLEDTKPVYEFIKEESSYTERRKEQGLEDNERLEGPKGNRAGPRESTEGNTVTPGLASPHRPRSEPHESTISRDTSAAEAFSIPHWLTDKGYNSPLHPPTNPLVSLILSHYGRYVYGTHQPRVYSYMAVNNIHNNRPFGQYKISHPTEEYYEA